MRFQLAFTLCCLMTSPLRAAEPTAEDQARAAAVAGKAAFDVGNFPLAIVRYEDAWRLKQVPGLLFNLGQSHRRAGHVAEALVAFRRYLETGPSEEQVASTEALLRDLERTQGQARTAKEQELRVLETKVALAQAEEKALATRLQLELATRPVAPLPEPLLTERWWFWAGVGAVVVGAVTITAVATAPRPFTPTWPDINGR
jgi:tetratricopeptide (TPR) repeat protein